MFEKNTFNNILVCVRSAAGDTQQQVLEDLNVFKK